MAQLNDLLVMGQSTLLGPLTVNKQVRIAVDNDALETNANSGSLSIGDPAKECMLIDVNEIMTMKAGNSSILYLNANGGKIQVGNSVANIEKKTGPCNLDLYGSLKVQSCGDNAGTISTNSQFYRDGQVSSLWYGGRDAAAFRMAQMKPSGYCTALSVKTTSGSWDIGAYDNSNWAEQLIFTYVSDTGYEDGKKAGTNAGGYKSGAVRFTSEGMVHATSFNATSDARLKENFQSFISQKSILDLPIYKFDFIDGLKNQIGCKAQDLQEICPEIVNEGSDGYLSIQESKIVYLLLEEVKKLRAEIEELKRR